jgi:hypothetical protein
MAGIGRFLNNFKNWWPNLVSLGFPLVGFRENIIKLVKNKLYLCILFRKEHSSNSQSLTTLKMLNFYFSVSFRHSRDPDKTNSSLSRQTHKKGLEGSHTLPFLLSFFSRHGNGFGFGLKNCKLFCMTVDSVVI